MNNMCNGCMLSRAAFGFQSRSTDTYSIIYSHKADAEERDDRELRERALFYVAATRPVMRNVGPPLL